MGHSSGDAPAGRRRGGRQPVKQREIIRHVRRQIASGAMRPGDRLPIRKDLAERFRTTSNTVQRAFDILADEGSIANVARTGSFVAERPPSLFTYGVAFPGHPEQPGWRGLDEAVRVIAVRREEVGPCSFRCYYQTDGTSGTGGDVARLTDDLRDDRIRGVLFTGKPVALPSGHPLLDASLPSVTIQSPPGRTGGAVLMLAGAELIPGAVERLIGRGCDRIALITHVADDSGRVEQFLSALARRGLRVDPAWVQAAPLEHPTWAANLVRLLFRGPRSGCPNGLIVLDDTLLDAVCDGLVQSEVAVGDDVQVIAQGNLPVEGRSALPIERFGFRIDHLLDQALDLIETRCRGEAVLPITTVPAVFGPIEAGIPVG